MASSKTRAKNNRPAAAKAARTTSAVAATPTSSRKPVSLTPAAAAKPEPTPPVPRENEAPAAAVRDVPSLWVQLTSLVLAIVGLAISAYETYAHFNGSHLAGCSAKPGGTFDCTAVITSSQSMVFGVIPVAILGLAFYVFAVVIFSPWAWRLESLNVLGLTIRRRDVSLVRLGSMIAGMGFVVYLIYAEIVQIGQVCEYCSGVHLVTFLLFCLTVFCAAIWGLGPRTAK
jgi:uncharacterized membrane protein